MWLAGFSMIHWCVFRGLLYHTSVESVPREGNKMQQMKAQTKSVVITEGRQISRMRQRPAKSILPSWIINAKFRCGKNKSLPYNKVVLAQFSEFLETQSIHLENMLNKVENVKHVSDKDKLQNVVQPELEYAPT